MSPPHLYSASAAFHTPVDCWDMGQSLLGPSTCLLLLESAFIILFIIGLKSVKSCTLCGPNA